MGFHTEIAANKQGRMAYLNKPCIVFMESLGVIREQGESVHDWDSIQSAISFVNEKNPDRKDAYLAFFEKMIQNINKRGIVKLMHE